MALITIGGVALPKTSSYKVTSSDLDGENTTRDEAGYIQRDRIRAGVRRIDATWNISKAAYQAIAAAVAPARFSVTFFDPASASMQTAYMYAGDRGGDLVVHLDEAHPENSRWELSVSLVEY